MSLKHNSPYKLRKEKKKWEGKIQSWEDYEKMEDFFVKEKALHEEPTIKGTVRIIAGKAKGVNIAIPRGCRPITDRMKTQLFDVLREDIHNKTVLDLYAGSGSFGFEALSRGAKSAVFVDASKHAEKALQENSRITAFLVESEIIRHRAADFIGEAVADEKQFEIIFMDPPYKNFNTKDQSKIKYLLESAAQLLPGYIDWETKLYKGVIIVKHPRMYPIEKLDPKGLRLFETFPFGSNSLTFFAVQEPEKAETTKKVM